VVTATPHIDHRFSQQGIDTVNVNNYPLMNEFTTVENRDSRKKHICYIGSISRMRGVLQVVQALPLVPDVRLTLCGDICEPDLDSELQAEPGWSQVDYLGVVDRTTVQRVVGESFAGLVTLFPTPNYLDSLPVKMFEYMAARLPIIASNFPLWQQIVVDAKCGLLVDPRSPQSIADAIQWILKHPIEAEDMGKNGRMLVEETYNWDNERSKLLTFYEKTLIS
jgi:glycosyltransferase involved in cell wall biosynthesis